MTEVQACESACAENNSEDTDIVVENAGTEKTESSAKEDPDPYLYTKLNDFTSEVFKIEIGNLPNYVGFGQLRKLLNVKLKLDAHKVKAVGSPRHFAFVTFRNEESRDNALKCLDGYKWKGKTLIAKKANPMVDPMARKRKAGDSEDCVPIKKSREEEEETVALMLKHAVTPLWNMPYEEQLKKKENEVHKFLMRLGKEIGKVNRNLKDIIDQNRKHNHQQCCPMEPIKPSPSTSAYRNKCEFSVGRDLFTKERTVGFRLNRYKEGSMSVAAPDDCVNISSNMLKAVKSFQAYIQQSDKEVYNPETHSGYWRQLTVRTSEKDVLLIIVIHPQKLTQEELKEEMDSLKQYFESGEGKECHATSIYFQTFDKKHSGQEEKSNMVHLSGKKNIEENLLGMTFQISPESFFQINAAAAEVLYNTIAEKVGSSPSSVVLDICCGTGTIGLFLAKKGAKVIGIEMCSQAIENAKENAKCNEISTVDFICGKAEDVVSSAINRSGADEIIAVANPPRAGLHPKVVKIIRGTPQIKKLVYVSCNPNAAFTNFVDLCRPTSNNYKGLPFYPTQVSPVDMFPHTPHYELVLVFERQTL